MNYSGYTVNDLVTDESFRRWVLQPQDEDVRFWEDWTAAHPEMRDVIEEARQLVEILVFPEVAVPLDADFADIKNRIQTGATIRPIQRPLWYRFRNIAAVLTGLALTGLLWFYFSGGKDTMAAYATTYEETRVIELPDGSIVNLNANSSLRLSQDWRQVREIWLEGEAYFDVVKDPSRKFIVHTGKMDVEVLGTTFNVNARKELTQILLDSGKVQLKTRESEKDTLLDMVPGEFVEYKQLQNELVKEKIKNRETVTAWTENRFVFDDSPLSEIAGMLEDEYGMEVIIEDESLAARELNWKSNNRDIDHLLTVISDVFDAEVTKEEDQKRIIISQK
ncbi:MAG: FecR domain-containing protein [Saprospiraceae bacterium]|nr:FecR domain-containing protein [Lewinella sp.]